MIIWKAITCAHLAASADITFYRSNRHVSGLLNPFERSKHQKRGPCIVIRLLVSLGVSWYERRCFIHSLLWSNSSGRHPFSIITHTDESVIYPHTTFPPCQSATFTPGRSLAVGGKTPTSVIVPLECWVVGKIESSQSDMFFSYSSSGLSISKYNSRRQGGQRECLIVRLDSWQKMHVFVASQPVSTAMGRKKNPLIFLQSHKTLQKTLDFLLLACTESLRKGTSCHSFSPTGRFWTTALWYY